jgi:hypothetical protein
MKWYNWLGWIIVFSLLAFCAKVSWESTPKEWRVELLIETLKIMGLALLGIIGFVLLLSKNSKTTKK